MRPLPLIAFLSSASFSAAAAAIESVSQAQWSSLNASVNGRLYQATPFARPCFQDVFQGVLGDHDASACTSVQQNYTNPTVRLGIFGSYMNTEWETCQATSEQCLLDNSDPSDPLAFLAPQMCSMGSIPSYYIDVREPSDVQAALTFANSTGVPLAVKNTGHDYSGRSSAPNSLAVWVHNLQGISYNTSFVPAGCGEDRAVAGVTFGVGITQGDLYNFAEANNITLPGGAELSVSAAGGYMQGGGHGAFSNAFGLAVDRVLEVKIVTPDGEYRTASSCENTDLFFAIRGGGGGTFGIVLEATMLALPQVAFPVAFLGFSSTPSAEVQRELLNFSVSTALGYAETGWGGYILPTTAIILANPLINMSQAATQMASLQDFAASINATFSLTSQPSFLSFFNTFLLSPGVPVGLPFVTTSRLIPADNFETAAKRTELVDTIVPVLAKSPFPVIFVVGTYFFKPDNETSVNPIWRKSLWHLTAATFWTYNTTLDEKSAIYSNFSTSMDTLREITPGSGAYFNEADVHEPNSNDSFWGDNYDRLVEIKRKYDPNHLLDCWQCVDSRGQTDARFSCYI